MNILQNVCHVLCTHVHLPDRRSFTFPHTQKADVHVLARVCMDGSYTASVHVSLLDHTYPSLVRGYE